MPPRKFYFIEKAHLDPERIKTLFPANRKVGAKGGVTDVWKTTTIKVPITTTKKVMKKGEGEDAAEIEVDEIETHEREIEVTLSAASAGKIYVDDVKREIASLKRIPSQIIVVLPTVYTKNLTEQERMFATVNEHMRPKEKEKIDKQAAEDAKDEEQREAEEEEKREHERERRLEHMKSKRPQNDAERTTKAAIIMEELKQKKKEEGMTYEEELSEIKKAFQIVKGIKNRAARMELLREFRKIFNDIAHGNNNEDDEDDEDEDDEGKPQEPVHKESEPLNPLDLGPPVESFPVSSSSSSAMESPPPRPPPTRPGDDDKKTNGIPYKIVSKIPHSEFSHLKKLRAVQPLGVQFNRQFLGSTYFGHLRRYQMNVLI